MDLDALNATLQEAGMPAYRQRQVYHAVTRELVADYDAMTALPKALRAELADKVPFNTLVVDHEERSRVDGSVKLRMTTHDGFPLEAVLMTFHGGRHTACLSSQSGCALACTFCATGTMGLGRNLTPFEIFDQFLHLARIRAADGGTISNVVMMGMGEPFHNYDNVLAACRLMNDDNGVNLGARRIAISTAGWVPGIEKIADEPMQVKLALSLHAPNNDLREQLMPVTKKYPLETLMKACRRYRELTSRRIFIEYLMLEGVNDQPQQAVELVALLRGGEGFHVNLIAYNPTGSDYVGSPDETVVAFAKVLEAGGVQNSYRVSRARDISGACGQLAAPVAAARKAARETRAARVAQVLPR